MLYQKSCHFCHTATSEGTNTGINQHLKLTFLKGCQRFNTILMTNLEVHRFWDMALYLIIFESCRESRMKGKRKEDHKLATPNNENQLFLLNAMSSSRNMFHCFIILFIWRWILTLKKTNQLGESSPNFIFREVNFDCIVLEKKRWAVGESFTLIYRIWIKKDESRWRLEEGEFKVPNDASILKKPMHVTTLLNLP